MAVSVMPLTLWLELAVLALATLLVVAGLMMAYGKRPEYPTIMASAPSDDIKIKPSQHSVEDRQSATTKLRSFAPKRYRRRG